MRGIVIDPEKQTVIEVAISGSNRSMYNAIGTKCGIDHFVLAEHDLGSGKEVLDYGWVDDEGIARGEPIYAFKIRIRDDILCGKCLILGVDRMGENCDAQFALELLRNEIIWLGLIKPELTWVKESEGHIRAVITYERVQP